MRATRASIAAGDGSGGATRRTSFSISTRSMTADRPPAMRSPPAGASTKSEIERGLDVGERDDLSGKDGEHSVDDLAL